MELKITQQELDKGYSLDWGVFIEKTYSSGNSRTFEVKLPDDLARIVSCHLRGNLNIVQETHGKILW